MSIAEPEALTISLLSGQSECQSVCLLSGKPVGAFSVGSQAQWKVVAEGVAPQHVHLAFDGRDLYAASSGSALLAGVALAGGSWTRVIAPCELRFAGGCIIIRRTPAPGSPDGEASTMSDGGALYLAAQQAVATAGRATRPPPWNGPTVFAPANARPTEGAPVTARIPDAPLPPAGAGGTLNMNPGGAARARPLSPVPAATSGPSRALATPPPVARRAANGDAGTKDAKGIWRSASLVKKVTLALIPFAVFASFLLFRNPKPDAPDVATAVTTNSPLPGVGDSDNAGRAAPAGDHGDTLPELQPLLSSSSSSDTAADAVPTSTASVKAGAPTLRVQGRASDMSSRTPEREALDMAAAGFFDEAATLYAALAAAHPDNPTFEAAARILHEKAARGP